ncbi:adaptor protein MecA [Vaginisenegalia massiliensis]|uniref:adaptor protein MecA n=1 Tax=Vaginisenegalia massiliensis TaxID=2058294 RepID=UPI000F5241F7|nr:adaptor protein MecA [Vaginisenegalia massiliensis]
MEMEQINDNLIKVLIGVEDLEERGINFLDLIGDQGSIEKFFYSILEEVDVDHHFHDSEAVTFQVMPSSQGLELYISRTNFEEMDAFWEDELTKRLKEKREAKQGQRKVADAQLDSEGTAKQVDQVAAKSDNQEILTEDEVGDEVFVFNHLDDFIKMARDWQNEDFLNSLYTMNNRYYLLIEDIDEEIDEAVAYQQLMDLLEYGEIHQTTQGILEEYGQLIRKDDAIKFFGQHF